MSRDRARLEHKTRMQLYHVEQNAMICGCDLLVTETVRTCAEQARIYRASRVWEQIRKKAAALRERGLHACADILWDVGPQNGPIGQHKTNAGPGESFHQYGLAVDCVPMVHGRPQWSMASEFWQIYGIAAAYAGMHWAGDWISFEEYPHIQTTKHSHPLDLYAPDEAMEVMRRLQAL